MEGLAYEDRSERLTETKGLGRLQNWKAIRNAAWICIFQLSVCRLDSFFFRSLASLPLLLDHAKDVAAQSSVLAM